MRHGKSILAVVPARSGSKGIPEKNLQVIADKSLIGWAAVVLASSECRWIDRAIISTDSPVYAEEAKRCGLEAPFIRPAALSQDSTGAVETLQHALTEAEKCYHQKFDVVLIIEPTCPFRLPEDLTACVDLLADASADSVVSVSQADTKFHPHKLLRVEEARLVFYAGAGAGVKQRQSLSPVYYRNGACYALTRQCLMEQSAIFTANTRAHVVKRILLNIDEPEELELARYYADVRKLPMGDCKSL